MTREEKIAKARELRAEGLTYDQIGERLGVTGGCVQKWLKPEWAKKVARRSNAKRNAAKRSHEQKTRAVCACGNPMGVGSGYPGRQVARCQECRHLAEHEAVDERAQRIVGWWAEGETMKQIASRLDWSIGHLSMDMDRLRARGYDLPYRCKPGKRKATAFPEQVAA